MVVIVADADEGDVLVGELGLVSVIVRSILSYSFNLSGFRYCLSIPFLSVVDAGWRIVQLRNAVLMLQKMSCRTFTDNFQYIPEAVSSRS